MPEERREDKIPNPDYEKLFELWGDFDDEESPEGVKALCVSRLDLMDSFSFKGFCAGFAAAKMLQEGKPNGGKDS